MGNRAVLAHSLDPNSVGIYLHWNGGLESVLAFLAAAKERGYRDPECDPSYGFARLTGLIHEFFDGDSSLGIGTIGSLDVDNYDNGAYLIGKEWEIVTRWGEGSEGRRKVADLDERELAVYDSIKRILRLEEKKNG